MTSRAALSRILMALTDGKLALTQAMSRLSAVEQEKIVVAGQGDW